MTLNVSISSVEWWFFTRYGRKVDFCRLFFHRVQKTCVLYFLASSIIFRANHIKELSEINESNQIHCYTQLPRPKSFDYLHKNDVSKPCQKSQVARGPLRGLHKVKQTLENPAKIPKLCTAQFEDYINFLNSKTKEV